MKMTTFARRYIVRSVRNISTLITSGMRSVISNTEFSQHQKLNQKIG